MYRKDTVLKPFSFTIDYWLNLHDGMIKCSAMGLRTEERVKSNNTISFERLDWDYSEIITTHVRNKFMLRSTNKLYRKYMYSCLSSWK